MIQYIDSIIAATWSEDGAVHDVCKALTPRFREPNSVVRAQTFIVRTENDLHSRSYLKH